MNRWVVAPDTLTHNTQKQSFRLSPPHPNKSPTLVADSKSDNPKIKKKKKDPRRRIRKRRTQKTQEKKQEKKKKKKKRAKTRWGGASGEEGREREGRVVYSGKCVARIWNEHASLANSSITDCYTLDEAGSAHGYTVAAAATAADSLSLCVCVCVSLSLSLSLSQN